MTRAIYRIGGKDARDFLQGLITNDIRKLDSGPVYAAILTPQGKFLCDFILLSDGDDILLDVAQSHGAALAQRLGMYRLRADVTIDLTDLGVTRGIGPAPEGAVIDPRDPALGWRLYGTQTQEDTTDWTALRVAHAIPETGIELTPDTYILEVGFDRLNGVDFRKGCYVGQEVTARMRHKTELKKGLRTLAILGDAPPGTPILDRDGKEAGTLFSSANGRALAHIRFDRLKPDLVAGTATLNPIED